MIGRTFFRLGKITWCPLKWEHQQTRTFWCTSCRLDSETWRMKANIQLMGWNFDRSHVWYRFLCVSLSLKYCKQLSNCCFYDLSEKMPTSIFPINQSIRLNVLPETGARWKSQRIISVITFSLVGIVIYQTQISWWSIKIAKNYLTKSSPKSVGFLLPSFLLRGQWMSAQNVTPVRLIVEILESGLIPPTGWPKYGIKICFLWPSVLGCSLLWLRGRARVLLLEGRWCDSITISVWMYVWVIVC